MNAHGFAELLDPAYRPNPSNPIEVQEFREKQNSMFFVLATKVITSTGRMIVQREKRTRNAQLVLYNLAVEESVQQRLYLLVEPCSRRLRQRYTTHLDH